MDNRLQPCVGNKSEIEEERDETRLIRLHAAARGCPDDHLQGLNVMICSKVMWGLRDYSGITALDVCTIWSS